MKYPSLPPDDLPRPMPHSLCDLARLSEDWNSDVLGSYTGTPVDGVEPVQDVDDL